MENLNLLEALAYHTKTQPEKTAVHLLNSNDIEKIDATISYRELFHSAYHLAKTIAKETQPGDRVMLCYPTGINFIVAFYACLFAKVIAVPVSVPSHVGLIKKFLAFYHDCKPVLVLTDTSTNQRCLQSVEMTTYLHDDSKLDIAKIPQRVSLKTITTDQICLEEHIEFEQILLPEIQLDDLALLQYTSGSTSSPKGVMVTHDNLTTNITVMTNAYKSDKQSVVFSWLPHTHDMGLIGSILHTTSIGGELFLTAPMLFIRRPLAWLQALDKYRVTITVCPCFALKMCLDHLTLEKINLLDLSRIQNFVVGSEPLIYNVIRDFFTALAPAGLSENAFAPAYGLAEATLMVSTRLKINSVTIDYRALTANKVKFAKALGDETIQIVSCGYPHQDILIVSHQTHALCTENEIGEIWLRGRSVACGYWQQENMTQHYFQATLANDSSCYFKTGDLGFLHQGELYVVGRLKESIIINGLNHYPQDIEQSILMCDEALLRASCVVFRYRPQEAMTDTFVILVKPNKRMSTQVIAPLVIKIRKQILKEFQLVPYDIQFVAFNLPKTTSGKLQRNECGRLYREHYLQKHESIC